MFEHRYRVPFYDTDAMGVVHHSNYVRIMEAGRVAWMRELGLMKLHIPNGPLVLAVTHLQVDFAKPSLFDDEIRVFLEGKLEGAEVVIRYALWLDRTREWIATGLTRLAPLVAATLKPTRFPMELRQTLRLSQWDAQWPPAAP